MTTNQRFSICGMCTSRCPMMAEVKDGEIRFLQGNPHVAAMKGSLCARGAAGMALIQDPERPQRPMIRVGERGQGLWKTVKWDEALDHVAEKLTQIKEKYGAKSISLSDRGGPFRDMRRSFLRGIGTPNYCNHDASCARNVHHAHLSLPAWGERT